MSSDWYRKGPHHYWWRDVLSLVPEGQGTMVDIGCGEARQREAVMNKGYDWVGIDVERRERAGPQCAGMGWEDFERGQALRYAGHLLWVARRV